MVGRDEVNKVSIRSEGHNEQGEGVLSSGPGDAIENLRSIASRCALCGFCQAVCPTIDAAGYRESHGPRGRVLIAGALARGEASSLDPFYTCLGCRVCYYACPAGIDVWEVSREARRIRAGTPREDPLASAISSAISGLEDPLGLTEREISRWSDGLDIPRPSPGDGRALLITGHMYQLMPYVVGLSGLRGSLGVRPLRAFARAAAQMPQLLRLARAFADRRSAAAYDGYLRNIALLLRAARIEFSYDPREPYPGTLLYELGHDAEFARYARAFADYLRGLGASRVITVDPHTYDLLAAVYPRYVEGFGADVEVLHYADLLGGLELKNLGISVAYHEPCHFAVRDEPFTSMGSLLGRAAEVRYASRSGRRNMCCGGPAELLRGDVADAVSRRRFRDLKGTGAGLIVTACPICHANLDKDGSVVDASEVLADAAGVRPLSSPSGHRKAPFKTVPECCVARYELVVHRFRSTRTYAGPRHPGHARRDGDWRKYNGALVRRGELDLTSTPRCWSTGGGS